MKMPRREFSAVLLAGGASARMGQPKATLRFGDAPLLERLVNELSREFAQVVVVAAPEKQEPFVIRQLLPEAGEFVIVRDDGAYKGPSRPWPEAFTLPRATSRSRAHAISHCCAPTWRWRCV